jgi:hypothetical protein
MKKTFFSPSSFFSSFILHPSYFILRFPMMIPVIQFPRRRGRQKAPAQAAAPPGVLTLVSAAYNSDALFVDLHFDRAINIGGVDVTQFELDDQTFYVAHFVGSGKVLVNPTTLRISLEWAGDNEGADVTLTASALNGIVASGDGAMWAGVTDLVLPYP